MWLKTSSKMWQVKCDLRHPSKMWCDVRHPSKMWLKTSK